MIPATQRSLISDVLLCEDHPFTQAGLELNLRNFLSSQIRIHKALDGRTALSLARAQAPDLAIIDLELPDMTGLEVIKELQELAPQTKIWVLTNCQNPSTLRQLRILKVQAISQKSSSMEDFAKLFDKALTTSFTVLDPLTLQLLEQSKHLQFTPKELEVLEKIALGYSNQRISEEMGCALTTVRFHRANIMQKGGFRNAAEVTAWFLKGKNQTNPGT